MALTTLIKSCLSALDQHQSFQRAFDVYRLLIIRMCCALLSTSLSNNCKAEKCKSLNSIFNVGKHLRIAFSRRTYFNTENPDPLKAVYRNMTVDIIKYLQSFTSNELRSTEMFLKWESYLEVCPTL